MSKKNKTVSFMVSMASEGYAIPIEARSLREALSIVDAIRFGMETADGILPMAEVWERVSETEGERVFPSAEPGKEPMRIEIPWPRPFKPAKDFRFVVCTSTTTGGVALSRHKDAQAAKAAAAKAKLGRTEPVIWGELANSPKPGEQLSAARLCDILTEEDNDPTPPTSRSYVPELPEGENA